MCGWMDGRTKSMPVPFLPFFSCLYFLFGLWLNDMPHVRAAAICEICRLPRIVAPYLSWCTVPVGRSIGPSPKSVVFPSLLTPVQLEFCRRSPVLDVSGRLRRIKRGDGRGREERGTRLPNPTCEGGCNFGGYGILKKSQQEHRKNRQ